MLQPAEVGDDGSEVGKDKGDNPCGEGRNESSDDRRFGVSSVGGAAVPTDAKGAC